MKGASLAEFALNPDPAPMTGNQFSADMKTQTKPLSIDLEYSLLLIEPIEDFFRTLGANPTAGVGH